MNQAIDKVVDIWYIANNMEYQHLRNQVYLLNYHLVWCSKRRRPVLVGKIAERLREVFNEVAQKKQVEILALEINPDYLHLFISCPPQIMVHKIAKAFKSRSSHILRREFLSLLKMPSLWTNNYFVSTARDVSSETIQKYIKAQSTL